MKGLSMTKTFKVIFLSVFGCSILLFTACSNRAVYESVRLNQQNECQKLPPGEYEKCMEQHEMDYDDYQRERERVLKEDAQ